MEPMIQRIYDLILEGDDQKMPGAVQSALDAGNRPDAVLNDGMVPAMTEVGRLFELGEYYVTEMLIAARAMQAGLVVLKPHLLQDEVKAAGKIVIGTVQGDMHDVGKNLVALMLEGAAFEVVDLGVDVSPEKFVEAVREHKPDILGLSALLTTTMPNMKVTIEALKTAKLRDCVKVIVGGASVSLEYARLIGADGYSPDASRAVTLAKSLIG